MSLTTNYSTSKELFDKASTLIPGGVNSPVRAFKQVGGTPIYFQSARGARFKDADGNTYTDYCQSWGPLILGHSRPEVIEAVTRAAADGLSYGACHKGEIDLAELVLDAFPEFNRVRFVSSGTEAVMTALRVARGVTGRELVVKFEGGYHGHFDGMLVKAGSGLATHAIASSKGIPPSIAATTLALPLDGEEAVKTMFDKHGDNIAALIIEPLPANNGLLEQRKEYLQFLRDITRQYGSLLIFDEVISGFRLKFGGYFQMTGVQPDIVTLGKIIGGGLPVGALAGNAQTLDQLSPLGGIYQAGTLSGNPVSLAAGKATLDILKNDPPYQKMNALAEHFVQALAKCGSQKGLDYTRAVQKGSLLWLYLDDTPFPRSADTISSLAMDRFTKIYWGLLHRGHYLPPSSYEVLFLGAAHETADVDALATDIVDLLQP